jgi:hypothetical protein
VALIERDTRHRIAARAASCLTGIRLRAGIRIIARRTIGFVRVRANARRRIAYADIVALIQRDTRNRIATRASSRLAGIRLRARIRVIARRTIGFVRVRAHARGRIAYAHVVALIQRDTRHRIAAGTSSRLAGIRLRAGIRIIARRTIGFVRVRANTRSRIAYAHVVALIQRDTRDSDCRPRSFPLGRYPSACMNSCHCRTCHWVCQGSSKRP